LIRIITLKKKGWCKTDAFLDRVVTMKEEFSKKLKTKRIELGISLEDAVEQTKLHPTVIKDLEEARWERISNTYLKGFLRIYCAYLGIPFDEGVLKDFWSAREANSRKKPLKTRETKRQPLITLPPLNLKYVVVAVAGCVALVLLFSIVSWLRGLGSRKPDERPQAPVVSTHEMTAQLAQGEGIYVTITAKKDCFVRTRVEGHIVFEGILRRGTVESWKAKEKVEFKISDGSAVDVEVNGKLLPALTRIRKPIKSLTITPQGIMVEK
jgi:cytoskeletal protein RodZ